MYLKRLISVVIITITISWLTGKLFDHRYHQRWNYLYFDKIDHLIKNDSSYDLVFFGDSRVHHGINPFYIDSISGLTSYNFGFPGSDAEELELSSTVYLQHHKKPRLVVLTITPGLLGPPRILKQRFAYLSYLDNDTVSGYVQRNGFPSFIKYAPFLKYSYFDEYNKMSIFLKGHTVPVFDHNQFKGFLNVDQYINTKGTVVFGNDEAEVISDTSLNFVKNTIEHLNQFSIKIVLIYPPEKKSAASYTSLVKKQTDSILSKLSEAYHVPIWHFDGNSAFTDEYFVDDVHLNEPGSRIFSHQLADSILKYLK